MLEKLQPLGTVPSVGSKPLGYVNNFIFLPRENEGLARRIAKRVGSRKRLNG
jgi:hypothetical protein